MNKKLYKRIGIVIVILGIFILVFIKKLNISNENIKLSEVDKKIEVGIIFTGGRLGDKSYNDLAYDGMLMAQKELGIDFDYSETMYLKDYEKLIRDYASEEKYDLIIAVGPEQEEGIKEVSKDYPNQKFTLLDSKLNLPNVSSIYTKWTEQTFLNGIITGMLIDNSGASNHSFPEAGIIIGENVNHLIEGAVGFEAGVRYVNSDINVVMSVVDGFTNPLKAKEISISMYGKGVNYIQHLAGESGLGVFSAANELDKYAFGIDANQNFFEPNNIIATSTRYINKIVFEEIKKITDGTWKSGIHISGLKEDDIGITREGSKIDIPEEIMIEVENLKAKIINGEIVLPSTKSELEEWLNVNNYTNKN